MPDLAPENCGLAPRGVSSGEFERIRSLAYEKFGLDLRKGKEALVAARLGRQMRQANLLSFDEYCRYVLADHTGEALAGMIDSLTTNYTAFYREPAHFEFFRQVVLPAFRERSLVRIWSAACATGEEPYTLAMCIFEELGRESGGRVRILATDISNRALATARQGVYGAARCRGVPEHILRRCFMRGVGRQAGSYRLRPELRQMVEFRRLNLMEPQAHLGRFPLILCRNVMIYFDRRTREALVLRLADSLEPGGYLFVGHAESLTGLDQPLEYVQPAIYRKVAR